MLDVYLSYLCEWYWSGADFHNIWGDEVLVAWVVWSVSSASQYKVSSLNVMQQVVVLGVLCNLLLLVKIQSKSSA